MKCDSCGKKRRLFESFADIKLSSARLHLCASCNDLMYRLQDAARDNDKNNFAKYKTQLEQVSCVTASKGFKQWSDSLLEYWERRLQDAKESVDV